MTTKKPEMCQYKKKCQYFEDDCLEDMYCGFREDYIPTGKIGSYRKKYGVVKAKPVDGDTKS